MCAAAVALVCVGFWLGAEWNWAAPPTDDEIMGGVVLSLGVRVDGSAGEDPLGSTVRDWYRYRYSDCVKVRGWRLFVVPENTSVEKGRFVIRPATDESASFIGTPAGLARRMVRVEGEPETLVARLRAWFLDGE